MIPSFNTFVTVGIISEIVLFSFVIIIFVFSLGVLYCFSYPHLTNADVLSAVIPAKIGEVQRKFKVQDVYFLEKIRSHQKTQLDARSNGSIDPPHE